MEAQTLRRRPPQIVVDHYHQRITQALDDLTRAEEAVTNHKATVLEIVRSANDAGIGYDRLAKITGWKKHRIQRLLRR